MSPAYPLFNVAYISGFTPVPWNPETPAADLLQWWADLSDPTIANPEILSYRPVLSYKGTEAGDLRPYQPGRCYVGDGVAYVDGGPLSDIPVDFTRDFKITLTFRIDEVPASTDNALLLALRGTSGQGLLQIQKISGTQTQARCNSVNGTGYSETTDFGVSGVTTVEWDVHDTVGDIYVNGALVHTLTDQIYAFGENARLALYGYWNGAAWLSTFRGDGEIHSATIEQDGGIKFQYKCDEGEDDTSYDSSGNGNHGTILNNYPGFHSTQNEYSFQNEVGYSKPSTVYIPRNESIPAEDVLGNPLQYSGRAQGYGVLKNLPCAVGDGVARIEAEHVSLTGATKFEVEFTCHITSNIGTQGFVSQYGSTDAVRSFMCYSRTSDDAGFSLYLQSDTGTIHSVFSNYNPELDTTYTIRCVWTSGDKIQIFVDGNLVKEEATTITAIKEETMPLNMLNYYATPVDGASLWDVKIYINDILERHYPMSEGAGIVVTDISENNKSGGWWNYNLPSNWGTQESYAYNQTNGFNRRIAFDGVSSYMDFSSAVPLIESNTTGTIIFNFESYDNVTNETVLSFCASSDTNSYFRVALVRTTDPYEVRIDFRTGASFTYAYHNQFLTAESHQLAIVQDGVQVQLYIDGQPLTPDRMDSNSNPGAWFADVEYTNYCIGALDRSGGISAFATGTAYHYYQYDTPHTAQEVLDHYNGTAKETGLVLNYPLNDINPQALIQLRTFSNTNPDRFTTVSTTPTTGDGPFWVAFLVSKTGNDVFFAKEATVWFEVQGSNLEFHAGGATVIIPFPTDGAYHMVFAWHDPVNDIIAVSIDDGPAETAALVGGIPSNTDPYIFGDRAQLDRPFTGTLGYIYVGNSTDFAAAQEYIFNDGILRHPLQVLQADRDLHGMLHCWVGNETSGPMFDWIGDLTAEVSSGDPGSTLDRDLPLVADTSGNGNVGVLQGGYNWIDQPVAENPEVPAGQLFLPSLGDQIDWVDYENTGTDLPWAKRDNYPPIADQDVAIETVAGQNGTFQGSQTYWKNGEASFNGIDSYVDTNNLMEGFYPSETSSVCVTFISDPNSAEGSATLMGEVHDGTAGIYTFQLGSYYNGSSTITEFNSVGLRVRVSNREYDTYLSDSALTAQGINLRDGNEHTVCHATVYLGSSMSTTTWVVDGVEIPSAYGRYGDMVGSVAFQYPMYIGAANSRGPATQLFTGLIYRTQFYSRLLSVEEMQAYNAGTDPDEANLAYSYPLSRPPYKANWPANYMYGSTDGGRHIATQDQFAKLTYDQGISKFLNYREALTDSDLTNAKDYVK